MLGNDCARQPFPSAINGFPFWERSSLRGGGHSLDSVLIEKARTIAVFRKGEFTAELSALLFRFNNCGT